MNIYIELGLILLSAGLWLLIYFIILKIINKIKENNKPKKILKEYNDYSLSNRLDDICLKHHESLPYYPDDY